MLVVELGLGGGTHLIVSYARQLAISTGIHVDLVTVAPRPAMLTDPGPLPVIGLAEARRHHYDVAIGTWWSTAGTLFELDVDRRLAFLHSLDTRFYRESEFFERAGAAGLWTAPVDFIVVGSWIARTLGELRPDARVRIVRHGFDRAVFGLRLREPLEGPLRILVDGAPTVWLKGVPEALEATCRMREPRHVTLVTLDGTVPALGEDICVGPLDPDAMAALYAHSDVLLKLSRFEGCPLPPIEAALAGVPTVMAPFTGHDDVGRHGHDVILVGFDDADGVAQTLDLLARDRALLARLGANARTKAQDWPDLVGAGEAFSAAVTELMSGPRPSVAAAARGRTHRARLARARPGDGRSQRGPSRTSRGTRGGARAGPMPRAVTPTLSIRCGQPAPRRRVPTAPATHSRDWLRTSRWELARMSRWEWAGTRTL